ncbi:uncharacterized protein LOC106153251 isoform X2 [Lingula anatina]|nr:uncharacterized protein LOC106153251 isoform X2 [Lingula anatina]|eukprot:XP_013382560.1 uncharacterized protein LOC106153251 isoform X2 [Lingula anatina]
MACGAALPLNYSCNFEDPGQCDTIILSRRIISTIAAVGCILLLIFIIWRPRFGEDWRNLAYMDVMLIYLDVAILFHSIGWWMEEGVDVLKEKPGSPSPICLATGHVLQFSNWFSILAAFNITLCCSVRIGCKIVLDKWWITIIVCLLVSLFFTFIPWAGNAYGPDGLEYGMWCWIRNDKLWWQFGTWYIWLLIGILLMFFMPIIAYSCRRKCDDHAKAALCMVLYPVLYLICWIAPTVNRYQELVHSCEPRIYSHVLGHTVSVSLYGLLIAIAYIVTSKCICDGGDGGGATEMHARY